MSDEVIWKDAVAGARDAALLAGGTVYVFGYVTWAAYAAYYQLGPVPALDTQYFVAGLGTLLCTVGFLAASWFVNRKWRPLLQRTSRVRRNLLGVAVHALTFFLLQILIESSGGRQFILLVLLVSLALTAAWDADVFGVGSSTARRWVTIAFYLTVGMVGAAFYATLVFAHIPPELGGGAPRCAFLEIDERAIGAGTQRALFSSRSDELRYLRVHAYNEDAEINTRRQVFNTAPVYVWQVSSDWIIVRPNLGGRHSIQLPTSAVRSIEWIGGRDPQPCPWG